MNSQNIVYDDEFKLISPKSLDSFNNDFVNHTKRCLEDYKNLFETDNLDKLEIIIFDSLEDYRDDYRQRFNREPPEYSRGNFGDKSMRIVIDQDLIPGTMYYNKAKSTGAHEAFHIYYRDFVYAEAQRIVWFDEGMAQYFSREKDDYSDDEFFKFYSKFRKSYVPINNLNERVQGNLSVPDDKIFSRKGVINGYPLSYLVIKYLAETKGEDYLKLLMKDRAKILEYGDTILEDMITYFDDKFKGRKQEDKIDR